MATCQHTSLNLAVLVVASLISLYLNPATAQTNSPPTPAPPSCPSGCRCNSDTRTVTCQPFSFTSVPSNFPEYTTTLILSGNVLTSLSEDAFIGLPNLVALVMSSCQIQDIAPGAFNGLVQLRILNLQLNHLVSLPVGAFQGLNSLRELNLQQNQLNTVPDGALHNMTDLQVLELNNNPIFTIPDNAFLGLSTLTALHLKYCQLSSVPVLALQSLPNLQTLELSGNSILDIPSQAFVSLSSLTSLYLDSMELTNVVTNAFTGLNNIVKIDLSYNSLRTLDPAVFQSLTTLQTLILTGNLWDCTCPMQEFVVWLQQSMVNYYSSSWYCVTPNSLNGYVVYGVDQRQFACEPIIRTPPSNTAVKYGMRAIFECRADGDPTPTIEWYTPDGERVSATSNLVNVYTALQGYVLIIQSAVAENSGTYNCTARNSRGTTSSLFQVLVTDLPTSATTQPPVQSTSGSGLTNPVVPARTSCTTFTIQTRVDSVTDTSITISWTPYNGVETIDGYLIQSNVFTDVQTSSLLVNWTSLSYQLTNLIPKTGYTVCTALVLRECPLQIPRDQCVEVETQGQVQESAIQIRHRNEIIGTALAACFGTLFLMATIFLILWHYRKPKQYRQYDFRGTKDTAQFADLPEDIDGGGIILGDGVKTTPMSENNNLNGGYVNTGITAENDYATHPGKDYQPNGVSSFKHSVDIHADAPNLEADTKKENDYDVPDSLPVMAPVKPMNDAPANSEVIKEVREPKDKSSKVKKSKPATGSAESIELTENGKVLNTNGDVHSEITVQMV